MGAVKKAYMDWCEKNDKNLEPDDEGFEGYDWTKDFENWLDSLPPKLNNKPLDDGEEIKW